MRAWQARVRHLDRWMVLGQLVMVTGIFLSFASISPLEHPDLFVSVVASAVVVSLATTARVLVRMRRKASVAASGHGVVVREQLLVSRERIRSARLVATSVGATVAMKVGLAARLNLDFDSSGDAEAFLDALALPSEQQRRARFRFGLGPRAQKVATVLSALVPLAVSPLSRTLTSVMLGLGQPQSRAGAAFFLFIGTWFGAVAAAYYAAFLASPLRVVEVGSDGLRIVGKARWLGGRDRYIPYEAIRSVREDAASLVLELQHTAPFVMRFGSEKSAHRALQVIDTARLQAVPAAHQVESLAQRLERGNEDAGAWLSRLRELVSGVADRYRQRATTRDELRALLEAPVASAQARIAAAAALKASEGSAITSDLRRIATRTGDPVVEHVLTRIADAESEEALREVLANAETRAAKHA